MLTLLVGILTKHLTRRAARVDGGEVGFAQRPYEQSFRQVFMAARIDSVARFICERGSWRVTNLQIQKIMYMAQMVYMGRNNGERLVDCDFEAWDYGPVAPDLYHAVKMFGSQPIRNVFFNARAFASDSVRKGVMGEVCDTLLKMRPGELVDITHWPGGAWAKHYVPGARGVLIPDADIVGEYRARVNPS